MSGKKIDAAGVVWAAVRIGIFTLALALVLLLPAAVMIRGGIWSNGNRVLYIGAVLLTAGLISALWSKRGREGGWIKAILSWFFFGVFLLILAAALPNGRIRFGSLAPMLAAAWAGIGVGSIIQNNKKLNRRKRKPRNITNSNQSRRLT